MKRFIVGLGSSLVWPLVVVLVPAGITFYSARLYAESGPIPPSCDAGFIVDCADASEDSRCTTNESNTCASSPDSCACLSGLSCADSFSALPRAALSCRSVLTCSAIAPQIEACAGKAAGATCTDPARRSVGGTCNESTCFATDDAGFGRRSIVFCLAGNAPPDTGGAPDDASGQGSNPDPTPDAASAPSPMATPPDDSGCVASPGTAGGTAALLAAPVAIALLLARRRRSPRKM